MITKEEYQKARETVIAYEEQRMADFKNNTPCWIMAKERLLFVTTDKVYAESLYETGFYTMTETKLFNP